jgi:hypothetical protein
MARGRDISCREGAGFMRQAQYKVYERVEWEGGICAHYGE